MSPKAPRPDDVHRRQTEWKSDWTLAQVVIIVQRPFSWAVNREWAERNPFKGITHAEGSPRRPMTPKEFLGVVRATRTRHSRKRPTSGARFLIAEVVDAPHEDIQPFIAGNSEILEAGCLPGVIVCPPPTYVVADWHAPKKITIGTDLGWCEKLLDPDHAVELRALDYDPEGRGYSSTMLGFFDRDHWKDVVYEAQKMSGNCKDVYLTINPVNLDLIARVNNKVKKVNGPGEGATDKDVVHGRYLLLDADPVLTSGIPATDAEKARARAVLVTVMGFLDGRGWPAPIVADSGNGYHALHRVDLPADGGGLVKRSLPALARHGSAGRPDVGSARELARVGRPGDPEGRQRQAAGAGQEDQGGRRAPDRARPR